MSFSGASALIYAFYYIIRSLQMKEVLTHLHLLCITDLLFLREWHVVCRWSGYRVRQLFLLMGRLLGKTDLLKNSGVLPDTLREL